MPACQMEKTGKNKLPNQLPQADPEEAQEPERKLNYISETQGANAKITISSKESAITMKLYQGLDTLETQFCFLMKS